MPDFKKVARIPILDVCAHLGLELKQRGKQYRGRCPLCDHSSERAFVVTPEIGRYWCFGRCRSGGDGLELFARVRQVSKYEAAYALLRTFQPP